MATFRQRGDKWQARIQRKGFETQAASFTSLADAKAWARRLESGIDRGVALGEAKADKVTLGELLARYTRDIAPTHKGAAIEALRLGKWASNPLAKREAKDVRPADVAAWRDKRALAVGASTIRNELAILSAVYEVARLEWGYAHLLNPVKGIRRPAAPEGRTRRVDEDEVRRIVAATGSPALASLLPLAISTACRRGELLKATWKDVSLKSRTLKLKDTKNSESRTVALSPAALAILEALPRRLDGGPLFDQTPHSITVAFARAVRRARAVYEAECKAKEQEPGPDFLIGLRFHDARHEGASQLFEAGLNIPEVASMTGHKDWRMLRRYTHVRADALALKLQQLA
jgi:integrase